ncbi:MAG: hypothetical protein ACFFDW_14735 [Candidatus Thorarchaeota archaeon]
MVLDPFSSNLLSELIATIVGVALGIPAGIWLNNLLEKRRRSKEFSEELERESKLIKEILFQINDEINKNIELLQQLGKELAKNDLYIPHYNLKISTWKAFTIRELTLIQKCSYYKDIFHVYFEIEHMIRKIDRLFEFLTVNALGASRIQKSLAESILKLLPSVLKACEELKKKIENDISDHLP